MSKKGVLLAAMPVMVAVAGYLVYMVWVGDYAFHAGKQLYYRHHDYHAALDEYLKVKPSSEHYATAQRYIGHNIYGREWGQWEQGMPYLEAALRAAPRDPKVLEDVGRACLEVGRVQQGIELLQHANTDIANAALARLDVVVPPIR